MLNKDQLVNFLDPDIRKKLGTSDATKLQITSLGLVSQFDEFQIMGVQQPNYQLTFDQMRRIGERNVWVEACVRAIVDVIGMLRWQIIPKPEYAHLFANDEEMQVAKYCCEQLFKMNNGTLYSFSETLKASMRDCLHLDVGCFELVRTDAEIPGLTKKSGRRGRVVGFVPRDAATVYVDHDEKGLVRRYVQTGLKGRQAMPATDDSQIFGPDFGGQWAVFPVDSLVHFSMQKRSSSAYGTPPIMSLLLSMQAEMAADQNVARFLATGGVIPGFIAVDGQLDPTSVKRYEAAFRRMQRTGVREIPIISGQGKMSFQSFSANSREMELNQLQQYYKQKILSMYRVPSHILGLVEGVNRGTAFAQTEMFYTMCIAPYADMLQRYITDRIVRDYSHKLQFEFLEPKPIDFDTRFKQMQALRQEGMISTADQFTYIGQAVPREQPPASVMNELQLEAQKLNNETAKVNLAMALKQLNAPPQMAAPSHSHGQHEQGQPMGPTATEAASGQPTMQPAPDQTGQDPSQAPQEQVQKASPALELLAYYHPELQFDKGWGGMPTSKEVEPKAQEDAAPGNVKIKRGKPKIYAEKKDTRYQDDPARARAVQERSLQDQALAKRRAQGAYQVR